MHDTHGQYNKLPKYTPAELSRIKTEKEVRKVPNDLVLAFDSCPSIGPLAGAGSTTGQIVHRPRCCTFSCLLLGTIDAAAATATTTTAAATARPIAAGATSICEWGTQTQWFGSAAAAASPSNSNAGRHFPAAKTVQPDGSRGHSHVANAPTTCAGPSPSPSPSPRSCTGTSPGSSPGPSSSRRWYRNAEHERRASLAAVRRPCHELVAGDTTAVITSAHLRNACERRRVFPPVVHAAAFRARAAAGCRYVAPEYTLLHHADTAHCAIRDGGATAATSGPNALPELAEGECALSFHGSVSLIRRASGRPPRRTCLRTRRTARISNSSE